MRDPDRGDVFRAHITALFYANGAARRRGGYSVHVRLRTCGLLVPPVFWSTSVRLRQSQSPPPWTRPWSTWMTPDEPYVGVPHRLSSGPMLYSDAC